jgi:hypothetical protein
VVNKTLLLGVGAGTAPALGLGASIAFAGERAGNGEETPAGDKAKSSCAFSGLEDHDFEQDVDPGVTQNRGQIVRFAGPLGGADDVEFIGEGCNANTYPNK